MYFSDFIFTFFWRFGGGNDRVTVKLQLIGKIIEDAMKTEQEALYSIGNVCQYSADKFQAGDGHRILL